MGLSYRCRANRFEVRCGRIKSCGDLSGTATVASYQRCQPSKEGCGSCRGINLLRISPKLLKASSPIWRIDVFEPPRQQFQQVERYPIKRRPPMAKQDFHVDNHGSIILLRPLTQAGIDYVNREIGKDNGYQPYWPTVVFEPRYLDHYIAGIRRDGLVAR